MKAHIYIIYTLYIHIYIYTYIHIVKLSVMLFTSAKLRFISNLQKN